MCRSVTYLKCVYLVYSFIHIYKQRTRSLCAQFNYLHCCDIKCSSASKTIFTCDHLSIDGKKRRRQWQRQPLCQRHRQRCNILYVSERRRTDDNEARDHHHHHRPTYTLSTTQKKTILDR